jgi:predicted nucleic acid-binding protein
VAVEIKIVVTDAAPLISLAAAKSLDYLLYPALPVIIPDAVFHEATASAGKLGAQEILDWYRAHLDVVRIEPTGIFLDEMTLREQDGRRLARDLGERAALEVIRSHPLAVDERALLLMDDRDAERLIVVDPAKLVALTTLDYLRQLEEAQRIQSADAVIDAVRAAGRNPPDRTLWGGHDPEIRDAVKAVLDAARSPKV